MSCATSRATKSTRRSCPSQKCSQGRTIVPHCSCLGICVVVGSSSEQLRTIALQSRGLSGSCDTVSWLSGIALFQQHEQCGFVGPERPHRANHLGYCSVPE